MHRIVAAGLILLSSSAFAGDTPDFKITPGVVTGATKAQICATKWGKDKRHVTTSMKNKVLELYAGTKCRPDKHGRTVEIDHSCSRELGGADDIKNLWKQCYSGRWNAVMKDRLENFLHKEVCAERIDLKEAQTEICFSDWRKSYEKHFP